MFHLFIADKIDQVLSNVGITVDTLSQSGIRNLKMLSDLAACLRIKDTRHPRYDDFLLISNSFLNLMFAVINQKILISVCKQPSLGF